MALGAGTQELGCLDRWLKVEPGNQLLYPPQVVITASQIQWTADVTKCLMTAKERSDKKILKVMKKKQVGGSSSVRQAWGWNGWTGDDRITTGDGLVWAGQDRRAGQS